MHADVVRRHATSTASPFLRGARRCVRLARLTTPENSGWLGDQPPGVLLHLGQIVERIGVVQLAGVDQAHEQIAHPGTIQHPIEQRVFPVQDRFATMQRIGKGNQEGRLGSL